MPEGRNEKTPKLLLERERILDQRREVQGIWEAIHFVDKLSKGKRTRLDEGIIQKIQEKIMGHYHPEVKGRYRDFDVEISEAGFAPTHHSQVRGEMLGFGRELTRRTSKLDHSLNNMEEVIKTAAWAHYALVRIHPFAEGNGRTARLLVDLITKKGGMYYITDWGNREAYLDALERVNQSGDIGHFEKYLAGRFAQRYDDVSHRIIRGRTAKQEKVSPVLGDLLNRKQILLRLAV